MTKRNTGISIAQLETVGLEPQEFWSRDAALHLHSRSDGNRRLDGDAELPNDDEPGVGCVVKQLPSRLVFRSAEVAAMVNPTNAPVIGRSAAVDIGVLPTPLAAAVATSKYWGPTPRTLTVSFLDGPPADLRRRIVSHLNAWTRTGCIEFVETEGIGQVRIARGAGGYWSYLGTDVLLIPQNRPTMNLQAFSMSTPESEFIRVIRHEAGHTLGMPHEHMRKALVDRIDRQKAYDYFLKTYGWDAATVDQQVLTPLDDATLMFTPVDQDSIMCYQLPGAITKDGKPIRGGIDINATDYEFVGKIYPKPHSGSSDTPAAEEWAQSEDVAQVGL